MAQNSMVKESLSASMVSDGAALLGRLQESHWKFNAALWFYFPDANGWQLLIASPEVEEKGPRESYAVIQKQLSELNPIPSSLSLDDIGLMPSNHPLIVLLSTFVATGDSISNIRFSKNVINGQFSDDALIYRMNPRAAA